MRRLMLLRHAKTEANSPSGRDFDRRLDARGLSDAGDIGRWLSRQAIRPDRVLVSAAIRACRTYDIVKQALADAGAAPEMAELQELYGAGPSQLLAIVRNRGETAGCLMVVAHNPGLHEFAMALTEGGDDAARAALAENFPTSALASLDFEGDDWGSIGFRNGRLAVMITPKLLNAADRKTT